MEEYKGPQEESEHKEEYSFLQEVIKDEAGSAKKLKTGIRRMIVLGLVFGIVSCASFYAFKPWIEKGLARNPKEVTIPKEDDKEDNEEKKESEAGNHATAQSQKKQSEKENYRKVIRTLDSFALRRKKSMVELVVVPANGVSKKEDSEQEKCTAGVIVADNGQELLILGQTIEVTAKEKFHGVFFDGTSAPAEEKMTDKNLGLTVYAVQRTDVRSETLGQLKAAELGSSYRLEPGDVVILLGKPFGKDNAAGYGLVSSCEQFVECADGQYRVLEVELAGTTGGSGVVFDRDGTVVGVLDPAVKSSDDNVCVDGYAISDLKDVIEFMSNGEGVPYLGIHGVDVTDEMSGKHGIPEGVYVKAVEAGSPAMEAGIQSGDILTYMDDLQISSYKIYQNMLMSNKVGNKVSLKGCRQGAEKDNYVDIDFTVTVKTKK